MKDSFKTTSPLDGKKALLTGVSEKIENLFLLPGMRRSLKNTFPLYEKTTFSGKKIEEKGFYYQKHVFS